MLNIKRNYEKNEKIYGSCDNCNKLSSFGNRTCNNCFYNLIK